MWSYDNQDPGLEPVLKQLSKDFEKSHPGVKINLVFKDFNSLVGTVPRALASGNGPDVTEGNQGYQTDAQLVKAKLILPLTKYVAKYGWDKLYAPSTWGMFRWTPDGKSFGKGPVWGIAQTGQNIVAFYNKKKLRQAGFNPNKMPQTFAGFDKLLGQLRAKLPDGEPVIMEGNKEGYGFIHLFGGIWGASVKPADVRNWIYHVPGSRYDSPGTIKALAKLQQWGKAGYFNDDYNALGYDASATEFAKGTGVFWIGGDWDSTIIKTGLGAANVGVMPVPPGPSGTWTSIGGLSGPVAHLLEDEVPGPRRRVAQLRDHVDAREGAHVLAAADPVRPPGQGAFGRPVPRPGRQGVPARRERRRPPALHRLGVAIDVRDAAEPVPAPPGRPPDAGRHGEGGPGRLGEVRQDTPLITARGG